METNDKSMLQTAKDLGVPVGTLHSWVRRIETGEAIGYSDTRPIDNDRESPINR